MGLTTDGWVEMGPKWNNGHLWRLSHNLPAYLRECEVMLMSLDCWMNSEIQSTDIDSIDRLVKTYNDPLD